MHTQRYTNTHTHRKGGRGEEKEEAWWEERRKEGRQRDRHTRNRRPENKFSVTTREGSRVQGRQFPLALLTKCSTSLSA